jgi:N-acetylglucosaminyl-diphospho-decaprenol L-rhamnosyltransferase
MDLSIVIVSWNTSRFLAGCLQAVEKCPPEAVYEVWVVDNASTDGSAQMVRERFPWVRLIQNQGNEGFARANNQAIVGSQARYIVLLNSDTEVRSSALQSLVAFMDTHPGAAAAGARLLNADGSLQISCGPMPTPAREFWRLVLLGSVWPGGGYRMYGWDTSAPRRVEVIKGACLMLRRDALATVGLFDETYFMYSEEIDLCYRLARAGWELWWVPEAQVLHYGEASSRQLAEAMYVQLHRSKVQFFRKFGGQRRANWYLFLLRLALVPRLVVASAGAVLSPSLATRARIYWQLLADLPRM